MLASSANQYNKKKKNSLLPGSMLGNIILERLRFLTENLHWSFQPPEAFKLLETGSEYVVFSSDAVVSLKACLVYFFVTVLKGRGDF